MIWPRPSAAHGNGGAATATATADTAAGATTAARSDDDLLADRLWTQESVATTATDYNFGTDGHDIDGVDADDDDDDDDDTYSFVLSQPPSPAWETSHLESPFIPSAQPVFYPFSPPASGIRPLTPPSSTRRGHANHASASDLGSVSDIDDDIWDEIVQQISQVNL